jgi:hypothetical protein
MRLPKILQQGALLVAANMLGLVLNYTHQAQAAARLDPAAFGRFAVWLGLVGVGSSIGLLLFFAANYFVFSRRAFRAWRLASAAGAAVLLFVHLVLAPSISSSWLAVEAIALIAIQNTTLGQFQARLSFGSMAFSAVVMFGARVLFPNLVMRPTEHTFFLATPVGILVALLAIAPLAGKKEDVAGVGTIDSSARRKIAASVLLAVCASSFPVLDILMVARLAPEAVAVHFAQASLFKRIPYFIGALMLQVTLPHHLRHARGIGVTVESARVGKLEVAAIVAVCASAPLNALVVPWISQRALGADLSAVRTWIVLSTLNFGALLALFRGVQLLCTQSIVARPAAVLAGVAAALLAARGLSEGRPTTYLVAALTIYSVGALAAHSWEKKSQSPIPQGTSGAS